MSFFICALGYSSSLFLTPSLLLLLDLLRFSMISFVLHYKERLIIEIRVVTGELDSFLKGDNLVLPDI